MIDPDVKLIISIAFVMWCVLWALEIGFMLDRWQWWRRTRSHTQWVPSTGAAQDDPRARYPSTVIDNRRPE